MKGRLPQGVDFKAYPGRSSTPLPTAESKSAERINQLKIWNEAATNDDKRRLRTAQSNQALTATSAGNRRTDSFKDARDRHSASFSPETDICKDPTHPVDIFADPSDSESDRRTSDERKGTDDDMIAVPPASAMSVPPSLPPPSPDTIYTTPPGGVYSAPAPGHVRKENADPHIDMPSSRQQSTKNGKACCSVQ